MPQPARETRALPGVLPDLTILDAAGLIEKLGDANLIVRTLAKHELVERIGKESALPPTSFQDLIGYLLSPPPAAQ